MRGVQIGSERSAQISYHRRAAVGTDCDRRSGWCLGRARWRFPWVWTRLGTICEQWTMRVVSDASQGGWPSDRTVKSQYSLGRESVGASCATVIFLKSAFETETGRAKEAAKEEPPRLPEQKKRESGRSAARSAQGASGNTTENTTRRLAICVRWSELLRRDAKFPLPRQVAMRRRNRADSMN